MSYGFCACGGIHVCMNGADGPDQLCSDCRNGNHGAQEEGQR